MEAIAKPGGRLDSVTHDREAVGEAGGVHG